jgi:ankyrin repeat protein
MVDVNAYNLKDGQTCLQLLCQQDLTAFNREIIELLLKSPKIDVNKTSKENQKSVLLIACQDNKPEIVELLLTHPIIDVLTGNPLTRACKDPNLFSIGKLLLKHPMVDVNKEIVSLI